MGRKSREKRQRRDDPAYRAHAVGLKAEAFGRRVPPTPAGLAAAARARGVDGVVQALISRHNQRWVNVGRNVASLSDPVAETLHVLFPIDVALWRLGVRFTQPPPSPYGEWPQQLRWATDSACQAERMVLGCNALGAAATARTQFERWSANRSSSNGFVQEGTSTANFYTDLWSAEKARLEGGQVWTQLSELLHGRGALVAAAHWEVAALARPSGLHVVDEAIVAVQTAVQLSLRQVLLCVASLTSPPQFPPGLSESLRQLPLALPSEVVLREARPAIWPLTLDGLQLFGSELRVAGDAYLSDVRELASGVVPRQLLYSERSLEALLSRRSRAAALAIWAFEEEATALGEDFEPGAIKAREFAYIVINETAGLLASWLGGPVSDAMAVGASALRAAFWLWLEDDERAMVLARSVLEQTARLRAWRLKEARAVALEARGERTSTRDWLEVAGWRRLSILNRSLGEFSHASPSIARWSGAREALARIQPPNDAKSEPIQTARGSALNQAAFAFGSEVMAWSRRFGSLLADAFASVLPYGENDTTPDEIEVWLQRCWDHRDLSFGDPDFM